MPLQVDTAIIPAAGQGKRLRPLTGVIPKELLPVGPKPMIEYCLEEALACGIRRICIVISREKEIIREYIKRFFGRTDAIITFRYQERCRGIADAVRNAKDFVTGSWFCILVPDLLFWGRKPALSQLVRIWQDEPAHTVGLYKLQRKEETLFDVFGLNEATRIDNHKYRMTYLYEKNPDLRQRLKKGALIVTPPYIMSPAYFEYLNKYDLKSQREIDDGPILRALMRQDKVLGVRLRGRLFDAGNARGYAAACRFFANKYLVSKEADGSGSPVNP